MLKNGLKHKKMHFLPVFELMSDSLMKTCGTPGSGIPDDESK
jgi:hypothetical protein